MKINYIETIEAIETDFQFTFDTKTEYYILTNGNYPHTDNTKSIELNNIEQVKELLFNLFEKKDCVNIDCVQMDENEYNHTLLANCGETFTDFYEKNDIITVFYIW